MNIGEVCTRDVTVCSSDTEIAELARLMREQHVGDVVLVKESGPDVIPVGIVTDRDIVVELVAKGADLTECSAADLVTRDLVTAAESDGIDQVVEKMQAAGVRRIPVVNSRGTLVGIASSDDILEALTEQLQGLTAVVAREQVKESKLRK